MQINKVAFSSIYKHYQSRRHWLELPETAIHTPGMEFKYDKLRLVLKETHCCLHVLLLLSRTSLSLNFTVQKFFQWLYEGIKTINRKGYRRL